MHSCSTAGLHHTSHLVALILTDQVRDGICAQQDLGSRNPSCRVIHRHKTLCDNPFQNTGKLRSYLVLAACRTGVNDTLNGLRRTCCMERRQNQMSCLSGSKRCHNGLIITHLTHKDNIRVLTQRTAQCRGKIHNISSRLPLMDQGHFALIRVLDRVLNSDHMFCPGLIDMFDHSGQCGRLTAARRSCDQNQPPGLLSQFVQKLRHMQFFQCGNVTVQQTDRGGNLSLLPENIDPLPVVVGCLQGKINIIPFCQTCLLVFIQKPVQHNLCLLFIRLDQCLLQFTVDTHHKRHSRRNMKVRSLLFPSHHDQLIQVVHSFILHFHFCYL